MSDLMELEKIADLAGFEPGVYEGTRDGTVYTVAVGENGVSTTTRPAVVVAPPPPPPDGWKAVEPVSILTPETGQIQLLYPAQPAAVEMRIRLKWTPLVDLADEYEPFALVRRKGTKAVWKDLPLYFVLRNGNARFRTGVGVVMDDKDTASATWKPTRGKSYIVTAKIILRGTADLLLYADEEFVKVGDSLGLFAAPPAGGKPGPWPWDLMLQLGGPKGKAAGHTFENVVFEVRERA